MAYRQCKRNGGSHGVDHQNFGDIELIGKEKWLKELQEELKAGKYQPKPLEEYGSLKETAKTD
jgi:RNA-directed DNA polymerase